MQFRLKVVNTLFNSFKSSLWRNIRLFHLSLEGEWDSLACPHCAMHDCVKDARAPKPKFQMRWHTSAQHNIPLFAWLSTPGQSAALLCRSHQSLAPCSSRDGAWFYRSFPDIFTTPYATAWMLPKTRFGTVHFVRKYNIWLSVRCCYNIWKVFCSGFCFHIAQLVLTSVLDLLLGSPTIICLTRPWPFRSETNASF